MKRKKQQRFFLTLANVLVAPILLIAISLSLTTIVRAHGGDVALIHACIGDNNGRTDIVGVNDTCQTEEAAVDLLKNAFAGAGLSESRDSTGITFSLADLGVTTAKLADAVVTTIKLADGAVTDAKIANNASEASRIQSWSDSSSYSFDATGALADRYTADPGIQVVVPTGKAYYYAVNYSGLFKYAYSERSGSATSFYGSWKAEVLANTTVVGAAKYIAQTGYRYNWSEVGANTYWYHTVNSAWVIRLNEGTHNIKIRIKGYSDSTMNYGRIEEQNIQVMRIL